MKKFIALTLSVLMLLCCVACGDRTQDIDQPGTNDPLINYRILITALRGIYFLGNLLMIHHFTLSPKEKE